MQWTNPLCGRTRVKSWFAFRPVAVFGSKSAAEYRWLERVTVRQCYGGSSWINVEFIDKEKS